MADESIQQDEVPGPCRLLALPAELRNRIYEFSLCPTGVLTLTSSGTKRAIVLPAISPQLLATCSQINQEARSILCSQNEIIIHVDAHDTCWPLLSENRFPLRVISKFQHVCFLLECTAFFSASYDDVDFSPFTGLTALRSVRLVIIRDQHRNSIPASLFAHRVELLTHLLPTLPAHVDIYCHLEPGSQQQDYVDHIIESRGIGWPDDKNVIQISGEETTKALAAAKQALQDKDAQSLTVDGQSGALAYSTAT